MDSETPTSTSRPRPSADGELPPISGTSPIADVGWPRIAMPVLFIPGCNLRCPYCINRELVLRPEAGGEDAESLIFRYLAAEEPWLMLSGAEPLNDQRTFALLSRLRFWGFQVALATNGTHPDRMRAALGRYLVKHVVMDVKARFDFERYREVTGGALTEPLFDAIRESFRLLRDEPKGATAEWRMTMCSKFVGREDAEWLVEEAGGRGVVTLQYFAAHQTLSPELADPAYAIPFETLMEWASDLSKRHGCVVLAKEV